MSTIKQWKVRFLAGKRNKRKVPEPVLRLLQNSRRVPPSAFVPQRDSIFRSFAVMLNKIWIVLSSRTRKEQNLYERLANTVDEMEKGAQELDQKISTLKDRAKKVSEASESHGKKSVPE